jgi:hypothetical protein
VAPDGHLHWQRPGEESPLSPPRNVVRVVHPCSITHSHTDDSARVDTSGNGDFLVDLTVRNTDGTTATLHTTSRHPFWDDTTRTWVPAGRLIPGHTLETATNTHAHILAVTARPGTADMYNLTVEQLHTYYVLAGATPVLVHNNNGCDLNGNFISGSVNGQKLAEKLRLESANSPSATDGTLTPGVIGESREVIPGENLGNKALQEKFAQRGGAAQWGKYSTPTYQSPYGPFQVHYYYNSTSGDVMYDFDYKVVMNRR